MAQDKLETQRLLVNRTEVERTNSLINDFSESHRPDDLDNDWCYVSEKSAEKRVVHATTLVIYRITNVY